MRGWSLLARAVRWVVGRFRSRPTAPPRYRLDHAPEVPESVDALTVVAVGEGGHLWYAVLACPCGCGETIQLSLLPDDRPRWRLTSPGGVPTLSPSVWRHRGCRSHFVLRDGRVTWC